MTLDQVLDVLAEQASEWQAEAARRRALTITDPAADALDYCARVLLGRLDELRHGTYYATTAEAAVMLGKSEQAVREMCSRSRFKRAIRTGGGWLIPRREVERATGPARMARAA